MAKLVNRFIALLCLFGAIILIIMSSRRLFEQQQVLVQTPAVLVHQQPDLATKAVAKLKKGMHLDVVGRRTHWYQVRLNRRQSGWIRSDQINALAVRRMQQQDARHSNKGTVVSTNKTIEIITDQANTKLRAKPATKGKILAVLPKNKKLGLIKRSGNWYKVRTNDNQVGYVASWIVTE
ncbi:SH3 domain-containing protein [Agrilactobacillus fermenti]